MTLKYIMVGHSFPVIFTEAMKHSDVDAGKVTSAGFLRVTPEVRADGSVYLRVNVWGRSQGLNVDSSPDDAIFIEAALNRQ